MRDSMCAFETVRHVLSIGIQSAAIAACTTALWSDESASCAAMRQGRCVHGVIEARRLESKPCELGNEHEQEDCGGRYQGGFKAQHAAYQRPD